MPYNIVYHPRVADDLNSAVKYYLKHSANEIADRFMAEVFDAVRLAAADPLKCRHHTEKERRINLKSLPYNILFRVYEDHIQVVVVRHNSRRPSFGTRRL